MANLNRLRKKAFVLGALICIMINLYFLTHSLYSKLISIFLSFYIWTTYIQATVCINTMTPSVNIHLCQKNTYKKTHFANTFIHNGRQFRRRYIIGKKINLTYESKRHTHAIEINLLKKVESF